MIWLLRNVIGVNSGAGLAAIIMMCIMPGNIRMLPPATFVGALAAALAIYTLSRIDGSSSNVTIVFGRSSFKRTLKLLHLQL